MMDAGLTSILVIGGLAVTAAGCALALLVRRDLAPAGAFGGAFDGGGRWILGGALGVGVIAFTLKLVVMSTLAAFPARTIDPLVALGQGKAPSPPGPSRGRDRVPAGPLPWLALPERAPDPPDNPRTPAKVTLGERLFHDPALSASGTVSCASCHDVTRRAGDDGRAVSEGAGGQQGSRNAPGVYNAAFLDRLFWDGRAVSLEEQALGPLLNPVEMGMESPEAVAAAVASVPGSGYRAAFDRAFGAGTSISAGRIVQAIAAYERTLVTADSPYDRFVRGDPAALTGRQQRGMWLFDSLGCAGCHAGPMFSGAAATGPRRPYSVLLASRLPAGARHGLGQDKGRAPVTQSNGLWRVPSLRNVALTAPYFHNGAVTGLAEAVRVMAVAQLNAILSDDPAEDGRRLFWDPGDRRFRSHERRVLRSRDVEDLVAFLHALSSDRLAARMDTIGSATVYTEAPQEGAAEGR